MNKTLENKSVWGETPRNARLLLYLGLQDETIPTLLQSCAPSKDLKYEFALFSTLGPKQVGLVSF